MKSSLFLKTFVPFVALSAMALAASSTPSGAHPRASEWFKPEEVASNTWRIDEHGVVNCYLVVGREKALVIDTGLGIANLSSYVRSITDLPLVVVNTHGHPDHAAGDGQFGHILAHRADFDAIRHFSKPSRVKNYAKGFVSSMPSQEERFASKPRPVELEAIDDGNVIDLGGREVEVISTPGHTAGEIVLLDSTQRLLFTGDNSNALVWLQLRDCLPLDAYLKSLERLNTRKAEWDRVFPGHGTPLDGDFVDDQIECVKQILAKTAKSEFYKASAGDGRVAKYNRASVVFDPEKLHSKTANRN